MTKKIFDDRGFLTPEGKTFVEDGFTKEVKRIFSTSSSHSDTLIISCILKSIVAEYATNHCYNIRQAEIEQTKAQIETEKTQAKIIPFPKKLEPLKLLPDSHPSLNELSDIPPIE
jgi:hypothetical protein